MLEHLLGEVSTLRLDMGGFLDRTRRMHPEVCRFVSEVIYDGRLFGTEETTRQTADLATGLRWVPVEHSGNGSGSPAEAERVALLVRQMLGAGWINRDCGRLRQADFMRWVNALCRFVEMASDEGG